MSGMEAFVLIMLLALPFAGLAAIIAFLIFYIGNRTK